MGGLIAQQLALDVPHRVRSLALLCTFAKGPQAARITPAVVCMGLWTHIGTRAMRRRAFLRTLFTDKFVKSEGAPDLASRIARVIGRDLADTPRIMMKQLAAMRAYDCSERLQELSQIPTLVLTAQSDPIALPTYGRRLTERISGSRYVEMRGASHGVTIQMPERVNDLLRLHFDRAETASVAQRGKGICR